MTQSTDHRRLRRRQRPAALGSAPSLPQDLRRRGEDGVVPLDHVCTPAWNLEQDRGRGLGRGGGASRRETTPTHETSIRAFHERWDETVSGSIEENVAVLNALARSGRPNLLHHQLLRRRNSRRRERAIRFSRGFDGIVVSGDERLLKPEPEIYQLLLDPLRPEGGRLHLHRRFPRQCGRCTCRRHARHPLCRTDRLSAGTAPLRHSSPDGAACPPARIGHHGACAPSIRPFRSTRSWRSCRRAFARARTRSSSRRPAPARRPACRWRCSTSPGSRGASSSCSSRDGSPRARQPTAWPATLGEERRRDGRAAGFVSARRSAAGPASKS